MSDIAAESAVILERPAQPLVAVKYEEDDSDYDEKQSDSERCKVAVAGAEGSEHSSPENTDGDEFNANNSGNTMNNPDDRANMYTDKASVDYMNASTTDAPDESLFTSSLNDGLSSETKAMIPSLNEYPLNLSTKDTMLTTDEMLVTDLPGTESSYGKKVPPLKLRTHPCTECEKKFFSIRDLRRHGVVHTGERPHICTICQKTFKHSSNLGLHMKAHTGDRPHACDQCEKTFIKPSDLKRHLPVHTGERPHECKFCHRKFARSENLKAHTMLHTGERPYACLDCPMTFAHSSTLRSHKMAVHMGDKPYGCSMCERRFCQMSSMREHMVKHTGAKPHVCTECGKCFSFIGALKRHMSIHTGERNHQCFLCKKMFTRSSTLREHMVIHTGDRPHHCPVCDQAFTQASSVRRHMIMHRTDNPFTCSECGRSFTQASNLRKHMQKHTGEVTVPRNSNIVSPDIGPNVPVIQPYDEEIKMLCLAAERYNGIKTGESEKLALDEYNKIINNATKEPLNKGYDDQDSDKTDTEIGDNLAKGKTYDTLTANTAETNEEQMDEYEDQSDEGNFDEQASNYQDEMIQRKMTEEEEETSFPKVDIDMDEDEIHNTEDGVQVMKYKSEMEAEGNDDFEYDSMNYDEQESVSTGYQQE